MARELVTPDDDIGVVISDLLLIYMVVMLGYVMTTVVSPVAQQLQAQAYTGLTDSRVLKATPQLQWINLLSSPPYKPWITASFHNDGWTEDGVHYDWSVFIGVNNPDELHELASGEDYEVNMSGSDRRIEFLYYKTNPGQRASVRAVGKF